MAAAATLSSSACPSMTANDLISTTWNLPLDLEGDHVWFEVGEVAADLQPQHRVVVQGACLVWVPGGAQQQRARPPVPDLPAGVAADGFQVAVGNLGKVQAEPVPQQPDQVGAAARLHLRLEDAPAC